MSQVTFTVYRKAEPQGSKRAFIVPGKNGKKARAVVVDTNKQVMRSYRDDVRHEAMIALQRLGITQPMAARHVPVEMVLEFMFLRPASASKRRYPTVAPDLGKLLRSTEDALIGVVYADDSQSVSTRMDKVYGPVEKVHISARTIEE